MKRKIILIIIFLLVLFVTISFYRNIENSKKHIQKIELTKNYEEIKAIKRVKNKLYILLYIDNKSDNNEYILQKYNISTLKLEYEEIINSKHKKPILYYENNKINIIFDDEIDTNYKTPEVCGIVTDILYDNSKYIYLSNDEKQIKCLYNVKKNEIKYYKYDSIIPFDNGYLMYNNNDNKIKVNDNLYYLKDEDIIKINNKGNILLTKKNDKLKIYDLDLRMQTDEIDINESIDSILIDKYIFFITNKDEKKYLYIWKYQNKLKNEMSNTDKTKIDNYELVKKIKEEFNINVYIYEEAIRYYTDFSALANLNDNRIYEGLNSVYNVAKKFNKEFFLSFINDNNGLEIYLTSKLIPRDKNIQIEEPTAYSLMIDNDYIIVVDIENNDIEKNICHEIMHSIEKNMNKLYEENILKEIPFKNWNIFNKSDFKYYNSYKITYDGIDTINEGLDAYFIDDYSKTYSSEDRARIFEEICYRTIDISNYPNILKKTKYLKEVLIYTYPSIKESDLFKNSYWQKSINEYNKWKNRGIQYDFIYFWKIHKIVNFKN